MSTILLSRQRLYLVGTEIILSKALFLDMGTVSRSRYPYMGTTGYELPVFRASWALPGVGRPL